MCKKWICLVTLVAVLGLIPSVWAGETGPLACKAGSPSPTDGATDLLRDEIVLRWAPCTGTAVYDVYLGTDLNGVKKANRWNGADVLVSMGQTATTYDPGRLELGATYYWRVDEVGADPAKPGFGTIAKGSIWSFTVEPVAIPVTNVTATASCSADDATGPQKTVDGSGLNADGQHSTEPNDMWLSCFQEIPEPNLPGDPNDPNAVSDPSAAPEPVVTPEPVWIQYKFARLEKLHQMLVWNWNGIDEPLLGFGASDVTVEYSTNGTAWTVLGDFELAQAPGSDDYTSNTTIDFGDVVAQYVRLTMNASWGGLWQFGLSEVRFMAIPVYARELSPACGTKGVPFNGKLTWRAGREAASHTVYVSADKKAVEKATAPSYKVNTNSFDVSKINPDLGVVYYWKVAEVNDAESPKSYAGDVCNFTSIEYMVVDDFESYGDIVKTWVDAGIANRGGSGPADTGDPSVSKDVVHSGKKSMLLTFNNRNSPRYIEVQRSITGQKNWRQKRISKLVLSLHGSASNPEQQLFVEVNGQRKTYGGSIRDPWWKEWTIDVESFNQINRENVVGLSIGVLPTPTSPGAPSKLYIDDIRLYCTTPGLDIVNLALKLNGEGSTKGKFDTLLAALSAADPKLLTSLSSEETFTVFAPTDDAFAAAGFDTKSIVKLDQTVLNDVLRYHIVAGKVSAANSGLIATLHGDLLLQDGKVLTDDIGGQALITTTAEAANGLIHVVDALLLPYNLGKIVDVLGTMNAAGDLAGQFDVLLAGIAADATAKQTLGKKSYTLFAPTDDAFAAIGVDPGTVASLDPAYVTDVLLYHIASGKLMSTDVLAAAQIETVQGGVLLQAGGVLTDALGSQAAIVGMDVETSNGVIHVIDGVLLPYEYVPPAEPNQPAL